MFYRFFSDNNKMLNIIQDEGGLQQKYKVLLTYLLSDPNANIDKITRSFIIISWRGESTYAKFHIMQNFKTVNIDWTFNQGYLGILKEKWEFPEHLDQNAMATKMFQDIEFKLNYGSKGYSNSEINKHESNINTEIYSEDNESDDYEIDDNEYNYYMEDEIEIAHLDVNKLIIPGVGVDGIILNQTTAFEIHKKYGYGYKFIDNNLFTFEMFYEKLGISCYYRPSDNTHTIYFIKVTSKFEAYTKENIKCGDSIEKVFQTYGETTFKIVSDEDYAYLQYNDLLFYVNKNEIYQKPNNEIKIMGIGIDYELRKVVLENRMRSIEEARLRSLKKRNEDLEL